MFKEAPAVIRLNPNRKNHLENIKLVDDGFGNNIPDLPTAGTGSQINLIRAVHDEAQKRIDSIDAELKSMEDRKTQLEIERQAHQEMLAIANKYMIKLNPKR